MKKISELVANVNDVEICEMPDVKLIGREMRGGGVLGNTAPELWTLCFEDGSIEIIRKLPSIIPKSILIWTGNYTEEDESFSNIVGVFTRLDTPLPKGFTFRILPATLVAKGIYGQGYSMIEVYKKMGYTQNYELRGWNAEIYFDDDPDHNTYTNLSPIRKA